MEKFGTWSDKATGVRPFVPITKKISKSKVISRYVFGFLKLVLCLPFLISGNLNPFLGGLIPIYFISIFLIRVNHIVNFNCLLGLMGRFFVKCKPTALINKVHDEEQKWRKPKRGTIVFAPLTSFLNLAFMTARFSPVYLVPCGDGNAVEYGFLGLTKKLLSADDVREGPKVSIAEVVKKATRAVVIFAEGAPTNGTGILSFVQFECEIPENTEVQIMGFKHEFEGVSPNFVCGSGFKYLLQIVGTFSATMSAVVCLEKDVPKHSGKLDKAYLDKVREVMGKLLRLPLLSIGADDFIGYRNAFLASNGKLPKEHHD